MSLGREKIRKTEAHLELNITTTVEDKKNVFINTLITKREPRSIYVHYWIWGEHHHQE